MKKPQQPPLNVPEQIENLKKLNLQFEDEKSAERLLNDISYFRLIKAYSLGLKPKNGSYYEGVSFEQIVQLYKFNSNLRQLLFPVIEKIEINLRCRIANFFSSKYGVLGYEESANFIHEEYHREFLEDVKQEVSRNLRSPFVRNFMNNYVDGKIPLYALIELFSFGTLSKFYKNMKNEDKKAIAITYHVGYTYLESWIESIAYVRNICAHYGRLYNAKLSKKPALYKEYNEAGIDNNRFFGTLLCIRHILKDDPQWGQFVAELDALIKKYPAVDIKTMSFPNDWIEYLLPE
jgi:abortive infection bacteriophage resistance protein